MQIDSVKKYLTSSVKTPYFLFISDGRSKTAIYELSLLGLDFVQMSGFCGGDDKPPDIDGLLTYIEAADVNAKSKKFVVTGLGEYLALRGPDEVLYSVAVERSECRWCKSCVAPARACLTDCRATG